MEKLINKFNKIYMSNESIDENEVNNIINRFNKLIISTKQDNFVNEKDVNDLISNLKSLNISSEKTNELAKIVENVVKIMICKQKCIPYDRFDMIPKYIF